MTAKQLQKNKKKKQKFFIMKSCYEKNENYWNLNRKSYYDPAIT